MVAAVKSALLAMALFGIATACVNRQRRSGRSNIESGSVDIPISLKFNQGPIPSASFSVGVESKMNQHVGNGQYKQHQFNSGFAVNGAAVPVFDESLNIQGINADFDTHMSHDRRVVHFDGNPNRQRNGQPVEEEVNIPFEQAGIVTRRQPAQPAVLAVDEYVPVHRELKPIEEAAPIKAEKHVGGLKMEYFIAVMCVVCACFLSLSIVLVILIRKKKRVVEQVIVQAPIPRRPPSVASTLPDLKPPRYELDGKKDASTTPEKKY